MVSYVEGRAIARRRAPRAGAGWLSSPDTLEASFAFAMVLPLLFVNQLGSIGPALFILASFAYGFVHRAWAIPALAARWPLLAIPAFILSSALWSDYPASTIKHGLEACILVAGALLLSSSPRPKGVVIGLWAAFAIFMTASVAFGHSVVQGAYGTGAPNQWAFAGLNGGKNLLGTTAGIAVLTSLAALAVFWRARAPLGVVLAIATLDMEIFALAASRSAGSIVAVCIAVPAFLLVAGLGRLPRNGRIVVSSLLGLVLLLMGVFAETIVNSVTQLALQLFNKDPTLTGRGYLWYRAQDYIAEHPWLGRGYEAFWVQGNMDAEGLWRFAQLDARGGFNFHNTLLELLVHLGWVGAILIGVVVAIGVLLLLRRIVEAPDLPGCFFLSFILYQLARSPYESMMVGPMDFYSVMLFAGLGYGFRALPVTQRVVRAWKIPEGPDGPRRPITPAVVVPRPSWP